MRFILVVLGIVFIMVVVMVGIAFTGLNTEEISVNFFGYTTPEFYIAAWILVSLFVGAVLGVLFSSWVILKLRTRLLFTKRQLKSKEKALKRYEEAESKESI